MDSGTQFTRWYHTLDVNVIHIFGRDYLYNVYETQAMMIAQKFYGSSSNSVIKSSQGMPCLAISKKLLGKICNYLLDRNFRIQLWKKKEGVERYDQYIEACPLASPGSFVELESICGGFFSNNEAYKEGIIASIACNMTTNVVGVACMSPAFGQVKIFQFEDSLDFNTLEAVLLQCGVREVVVYGDDGLTTDSKKRKAGALEQNVPVTYLPVLRKLDVAITMAMSSDTSAAGGAQLQSVSKKDLEALQALFIVESDEGDKCGADTEVNIALQQMVSMSEACRSLVILSDHMKLQEGSLLLHIGEVNAILQYDSSASVALNTLPDFENQARVIATSFDATSSTNDEAAGGNDTANNDEGAMDSYNAIENDIYGGIIDTPSSSEKIGGASSASGVSSLFEIINHTKTKMGARMLKRWVQQPSRDMALIKKRQDMVAILVEMTVQRCTLQDNKDNLFRCPDVEKYCQKFRKGYVASPVGLLDLLAVYRSVTRLRSIEKVFDEILVTKSNEDVYLIAQVSDCNTKMGKYMAMVEQIVDGDALLNHRRTDRIKGDKWIQVRPSFTPELQALNISIKALHQDMVSECQRVSKQTGLEYPKQIHLEMNSIQGIHLRVTKKDTTKLKKLEKEGLQTLSVQKSGTLFLTRNMSSLVSQHNAQKAKYENLQSQIVKQAVDAARTYFHVMRKISGLLAEIDCVCALAHAAAVYEWCQPTLLPAGSDMEIESLRHCVVEANVGVSHYVPSDFMLTGEQKDGKVVIITGPNMGGKSTYIRAIGLMAILAQMGSFVPATRAKMPMFDRILCRVGAGDSMSQGLSTFMSEMLDMATILKKASPHSLVIIDELGRGTSTHDGYGIAYASLQRLATTTKCFTVFATHFHELTQMEDDIGGHVVVNKHVDARVDGKQITFLRNIVDGACKHSFGCHVARLAQFPEEIVSEAEQFMADTHT
jgi:DNA mismatch repair ATPase MutS